MDTTTEALVKSKDSLDKLENARDISQKILDFLEEIEVRGDNIRLDEAEKIYKKHFFKLKHMRLKRALGPAEIKKILDDKSLFKKTVATYREVHKAAATGIALVSETVKYCEIFYSFKVMFRVDPKLLGKNTLTQVQNKLLSDYEKMQALAGVLKNVADYAPPFVKDYMTFVLDVFILAEGAIKMVGNYAQRIINSKDFKNLEDNMQTIQNATFDKNTLIHGSMTLD